MDTQTQAMTIPKSQNWPRIKLPKKKRVSIITPNLYELCLIITQTEILDNIVLFGQKHVCSYEYG